MTFVNELIPEEQKDKFDPEMLYINAAIPTSMPYRWVIDRERDMFLVHVGATRIDVQANPGECDQAFLDFYRFSLKGLLIKFEALGKAFGSKDAGWTIEWQITNLEIPFELQDKKDEIIVLIKAALYVQGSSSGNPVENLIAFNISFK